MARRPARPRSAAAPAVAGSAPCPCGSGTLYDACCGRFHRGEAAAATAEALMRSRYSAFAAGDAAYLLRTWHPATRPARLRLDRGTRWVRLEVLATSGGTAFHDEGTVTFRAHYVDDGDEASMFEHSTFTRVDGAWVYVAAAPAPGSPV